MSGETFTRNRYYFAYEDDDGNEKTFNISRGGLLNTFAVGQTYLVLHRNSQDPSGDNFIECVSLNVNEKYA